MPRLKQKGKEQEQEQRIKALYRVSDVGTVLLMSERSIWTLIKEGKLGHVRPSTATVRVTHEQLQSFIAQNSVSAQ